MRAAWTDLRPIGGLLLPFVLLLAGGLAPGGASAAPPTVPGASGPLANGDGSSVFTSAVGQPFAAPPVGLTDGGSLRSGFVEASEALLAAGAP